MAETTQTPGGTPQTHTLSASGADVLTLPEGLSVSEAEFAVDGSDLVLTFPDGSKVTVENYYEQAQPPQLASADGANLSGDMVVQLTGTPDSSNSSAIQQFADAAAGQVIGGTDGAPIGTVKTLTGEVWVTRADGTRVQLQAGDQVYQGDSIETGPKGAIGVLLADETTFSMGEASSMVLDEMVYDPATQNGSLNVSVVQGVFTFVSGQVAKTDPDAMKIDTPVATIGIRGTQVGIEIPPAGEGDMQIVLMQEADGFVGEVVIENNTGQIVMNQGGDFVSIPSYDSEASARGTMSDDDIVERHATTLKHLPVESTEGDRTSGNHFGLQEEIEQGTNQDQGKEQEGLPSAEELANTETAAGGEQENNQEVEAQPEPSAEDLNNLQTDAGGQQEGFSDDVVKVTDGFDSFDGNTYETGSGGAGSGGTTNGFSEDFTNVTDEVDPLAAAEQAAIAVAREIAAGAVARAQAAYDSARNSANNSEDPRVDTAADDAEAALARALQAQAEADAAATAAEAQAAAARANEAADDAEGYVGDIADYLQDVADAPTLDVTAGTEGSGLRGDAIELDINAALTDNDGSETLSVTISGVPEGATLSAGTDNGNGTWTLTSEQLEGLSVSVPDDYATDFQLTVTATSTESANGSTATQTATIDVDVNRDVLTEGDDTFQMDDDSVVYAGEGDDVITGTEGDDVVFGEEGDDTFIGGQGGSDAFIGGAGTDTVDYSALDPTSPIYVNLTDEAGQSGVGVPLFDFDLDGDIDADDAAGAAASGDYDYDLLNGIENVTGGAGDDIIVGSDGANVLVGGLGDDILAGAGGDDTIVGGEGTDTAVFEDNFEEFTVNLDSDSGELSVGGSDLDGNDTLTGVEVLQFGDLTITVEDLLNAAMPDLDVSAVDTSTVEDVAVALPISASLADGVADGTETLSVTLSGIPEGAVLSVDGVPLEVVEGAYTFADGVVPEGLTILPPADSAADFNITVTATSQSVATVDGTAQTTTSEQVLTVTVAPDAEAPVVTAADDLTFNEDAGAIDVGALFSAAPVEAGEVVASFTIGGLPEGATLSGTYTDNGDGTFTIDAADLGGVQLTLPQDYDDNFTLQVSATASQTDPETGDVSYETSAPVDVPLNIIAQADAPTATVDAAAGTEDGAAIPLTIDATTAAQDIAGEVTSFTVSDIPVGATLNLPGGLTFTATEGNTSVDLTPEMVEGLSISLPEDYDSDFSLTVTATATETDPDTGEVTSATSAPVSLDVSVGAVADAPTVTAGAASGAEDGGPIALDIDVATAAQDINGEVVSVTISGVPEGATLSAGAFDADTGVWTVDAADVDGLSVSLPEDFDEDFSLQVSATARETDPETQAVTFSTSDPVSLDVSVIAQVDAPTVNATDAAGNEDSAIALNIDPQAAAQDIQGEVTSVTISDIPAGATLTLANGIVFTATEANSSLSLSPAQLEGLTITPPADSADDFQLTVTVTATETDPNTGEITTATSAPATMDVTVQGVADGAQVGNTTASGVEDAAIPFTLDVSELDTDGSETLSVTLSNIPAGAVITRNGEAVPVNEDGSVTLAEGELDGLAITPPADFSGNFELTVSATTTDEGDVSETSLGSVSVDVSGVADGAALNVAATSGDEDTDIALPISIDKADESETAEITLSGIPQGAVLSNANGPINVVDGVAVLSEADLAGLQITPPADSSADFQVGVSVVTTDGTTTSEPTTGTIAVGVDGVADVPSLTLGNVTGVEDNAISLNISAGLGDLDGSETLSVTISGVPAGATLSAGTYDAATGDWTLSAQDLAGLTVIPAADDDTDFSLTVTATATDTDPDTGATTTESVTGTMDVTVNAEADAPVLTLNDATGNEDTAIPLDITATLPDASETLSLSISGIPDGAVLTVTNPAGLPVAIQIVDGVAEIPPGLIGGELAITPPADSADDFQLTVTATSNDNGSIATSEGTLDVTVQGVADGAQVGDTTATGAEDTAIPFTVDVSELDTDGSETLSVTLSNIPVGAVITRNGEALEIVNGSVTLAEGELDGLAITPPADFSGDLDLTVSATTTDEGDVSETALGTVSIDVTGVADGAALNVAATSGDEDTGIALPISIDKADESETAEITLSGIPQGAVLSNANGPINVVDGVAVLSEADLDGLQITPPADSDVDFNVGVSVVTTDGTTTSNPTTGTISVGVDGVADVPTLTVDSAVAGTEDGGPIALDISSALTDVDTSESLSITISGVPADATLSAGTYDAVNDTWTLSAGDLDGLTVTPGADSGADFQLTVTATSTEAAGGDQASQTATIDVSVTSQADAPTVTVDAASGLEDGAAIPLTIDADAAAQDLQGEVTGFTISDIPVGAVLNLGGGFQFTATEGNTSVNLTPAMVENLSIELPADFDDNFSLQVSATAQERDPDTGAITTATSTPVPLNVEVTAQADAPTVGVQDASGTEDGGPIALNIDPQAAAEDINGEVVSVTISGVPAGATLSAGTFDAASGEWTVDAADVAGLTVSLPDDYDTDFTLQVSATAKEIDPETLVESFATSAPVDLDVSVIAQIDAPTVAVDAATGVEDGGAIPLNIDPATAAGDIAGEITTITISDIPVGATLNLGGGFQFTATDGNTSVNLTPEMVEGLSISLPEDFDTDFALSVTATAQGTDPETGEPSSATSAPVSLAVAVDAVADAPTVDVNDASGVEGRGPIALDIDPAAAAEDINGEVVSVTISGVPAGATLSAGTFDATTGEWTVDAADLDGLSISLPEDFDEDFSLQVSATAEETDPETGAVTTATSDPVDLDVSVMALADAPDVSVESAAGNEDTAIALDIDADAAAQDINGEVTGITISGIPSGATLILPGGLTFTATDTSTSVTLTPAQIEGLTITPAADSSDDFQLTITATAKETDPETGETSFATSAPATLDVTVQGVADGAQVTDTGASGAEDTAIPLTIDVTELDTDGSETLSVTLSNIPEGAVITRNGEVLNVVEGTVTLGEGELDGLAITPPADFSGNFDLTVSATTTDEGDVSQVSTGTISVDVDGAADGAAVTLNNVSGDEDTFIDLPITIDKADESETAEITLSGIPQGAVLSNANGPINVVDGVAVLSEADLAGLQIKAPTDSGADFQVGVSVVTTDGDSTSEPATGTINVGVDAVADVPSLTVGSVTGTEDSAIPLNISAGLNDTDGSEVLSVTISDVPPGAVLTLADGSSFTATPENTTFLFAGDQLQGLTITPPENSDADFTLNVVATSLDTDPNTGAVTTSSVEGSMAVSVDPEADAPTLALDDAAGTEDLPIALNIDADLTDGSEALSVTISGVPEGATLSAGSYDEESDTWTLSADDLDGLTVNPAPNSNEDMQLTVTATSTESDGSTATTTSTLNVAVTGDADAPTLTVDLGAGVPTGGGTEEIPGSVTITNVGNASAGYHNSYGYYVIGEDGTPQSGQIIWGDVKDSVGDTFTLDGVDPADIGFFVIPNGDNLNNNLSDGMSVTFTQDASGEWHVVGPNGQTLSGQGDPVLFSDPALNENQFDYTQDSGSPGNQNWEDLVGGGDNDFNDINMNVVTVPTQPGTGGDEVVEYPLDIIAGLTDLDGSETLSATISGVPEGATLTLADGTILTSTGTDEAFDLTEDQLQGITLTVPAGATDFDLSVTATATENDGDTASVSTTVAVDVPDLLADAPELDVSDATGAEDTFIPLTIDAALTDADESLSVTISGIPDGAVLKAGDTTLVVENGSITFEDGVVPDNLMIKAPTNSDVDMALTVTATSTESNGDTATTSSTLNVAVSGVADAPTLVVDLGEGTLTSTGGSGSYVGDGSNLQNQFVDSNAQNHTAGGGDDVWVVDRDLRMNESFTMGGGNDTLVINGDVGGGTNINLGGGNDSVTINGDITGNASVNGAGQSNGGGDVVYLGKDSSHYQLQNLTNNNGNISVQVKDLDTGQMLTINNVEAIGFGDGTSVGNSNLVQFETPAGADVVEYPLDINAALTDTDGSETLSATISGVPEGATLTLADGTVLTSTGTDDTFDLTSSQLQGITLTVSPDATDFNLAVTATATENDGDTASISTTVAVDVPDPVADAPDLDVSDAAGAEDTAIPLTIDAALTDADESLSVTISGIPDGAVLRSGDTVLVVENGEITFADGAVPDNLTIQAPTNSDADMALTVTATSTESDGSTASTSSTLNVAVGGVADAPTLTVDLGAGVPTGGSEEVPGSVTITNAAQGEAGYHNTYGYYVMGEDGTPQSGQIVWADVKDTVGDTFTLDGVDPEDIGFFIIPNGDGLNNNLSDGMSVTFTQGQDGNWHVVGPTGQILSGQGDPVLFSDPALNEGNFDYTQDTHRPGNQNWEDLAGGGDNDFNDININVETVATQPGTGGPEFVEYPLDINALLTDTDGSETLSATISGVPEGATLTLADGTVLTSTGSDDSFDLSSGQLLGITLTVPVGSEDFDLSVTATSTETDGDMASVSTSVGVDVPVFDNDASDPTLTVSDAAGVEDGTIALDIGAALTDLDGSESLSITLSGIPDGAVLKSGETVLVVENGSITFADGIVPQDLTVTPPTDSGEDFDITVSATSTEENGDDTATTTGTINVAVAAVADAVSLDVQDTAFEDGATTVPLDISAQLGDLDGSEELTVTISGVPEGVTLSGGQNNGDGSWTLSGDDLQDLTMTLPSGEATTSTLYSQNFNSLSDGTIATGGDNGFSSTGGYAGSDYRTAVDNDRFEFQNPSGGDLSTWSSAEIDISGQEDVSFSFNLKGYGDMETSGHAADYFKVIAVVDGVEHELMTHNGELDDWSTITLDDIPQGDSLVIKMEVRTTGNDEVYKMDNLAVEGTTTAVTEPIESFNLDITATAADTDPDTGAVSYSTTEATLAVSVEAEDDASAPTVTVSDASGAEDTPIALDITAALTDMDGSEEISSITLSGIPVGATLNHGTLDEVTGEWSVELSDLVDLEVTPAPNSNEDFQITVSVTSTEANGGATATTTATLDVDVSGVVDDFTVATQDAAGQAGTELPLSIDVGLSDLDGSETVSVTLTGIPEGATLNHGTFDEGTGNWTLSGDDLEGLTISLPETVEGEGGGEPATLYSQNFNDTFDGQTAAWGDNGFSSTGGRWGDDDHTAADDDRFEFQNPTGGDISTFTTAAIDISGQEDVSFSFDMKGYGDLDSSGSYADYVKVFAVVDGVEHELMTQNGDLGDWTTFTLDDIPQGDELVIKMEVRTTADDEKYKIDNLKVEATPAAAEPLESFQIGVETTVTESDGASETMSTTLNVDINNDAEAEAPTLTVTEQAPTTEDAAVALNIAAALTDTDGSETLSVTLSGIPDGAVLKSGDTVLTVENGEITFVDGVVPANLSLTPPANSDADIELTISATSTEANGGATTTTTSTIDIDVSALADAPAITSVTIGEPVITEGTEGVAETVTISTANFGESDAGFSIAARTINSNGTLSEASVDNVSTNGSPLGFGVAGNASGASSELGYSDYHDVSEELIVTFDDEVSSADVSFAWLSSSEQASYKLFRDGVEVGSGTVNGVTDGIDDPVTLSADGGFDQIVFSAPSGDNDYLINSISFETQGGTPDIAEYPIEIAANLADIDGSEQLSVTIGGVPAGALLSAGADNGDGTWTVPGEDLQGLTLSVPFDGDVEAFDLTFTATATEQSNNSFATSSAVVVTAAAVVAPEPEPEPEPVEEDFDGLDMDGEDNNNDEMVGNDTSSDEWTGNYQAQTYAGSTKGDELNTGGGGDTLYGGAGNDELTGSWGNDTFFGGSGNDELEGGDGNDQLFGGSGNDEIEGGTGHDEIQGGSGNDEIEGGDGNDLIYGGAGNDEIEGGTGHDTVYGGSGDDEIEGNDGNDVLYGGSGNDEIEGGTGHDTVYGGAGNDEIEGDDGNDVLYGGSGNDEIEGGSGHDTVYGGSGNDEIEGNDGNDLLYGGSGNDEIEGGDGHDQLFGGLGDDFLEGGDGNDILFGGAGNDVLNGGSGNDTFIFDADSGHDIIEDIMLQDTLEFQGEQFDMNDMIFSENEEGDAVISFAGNNDMSVTLEGVKYSDLDTNGDGNASEGYSVTQTDDGFTVNIDET